MEEEKQEETQLTNDSEDISMQIIASAGDARSYAYEALYEAKKGNFAGADELLKQCEEAGLAAHNAQTELLFASANGTAPEMDVLLTHAMDHFMTGMLAEELIRELIDLYKLRARDRGELDS